MAHKLSIIIPCYNEENTLSECVQRVFNICDDDLTLEIIIVDDASTDGSLRIANLLQKENQEIVVLSHDKNKGKGAALKTGFEKASGDFVAVQDADLEYDPQDLKRLIVPLVENKADVVLGSRFLTRGAHRVLYFWHSVGNKFLTLLSNMFTDLNLTDMETCYKVFKREIIQSIDIKENRFGFEPEIVAKVAQMRVRIFEMGISYYGRTYEEGKKIGVKDGIRALYCIFRYNAHKAPMPIQFLLYTLIGGLSAISNVGLFLLLYNLGFSVHVAAPTAFVFAALINYLLCIMLLFRHRAQWNTSKEILFYSLFVIGICLFDLWFTVSFISYGVGVGLSKIYASIACLLLNFSFRRFFIFKEAQTGPWK